jgi:fibro-slime domain-containing protein
MRGWLALVAVGALLAGFVACGGDDDESVPADAGADGDPRPTGEPDGATADASDGGVGPTDPDACPDGGCTPPDVCGDGLVTGKETCDPGDAGDAGPGCTKCRIDPGFACDLPSQPCRAIVCNDGKREGAEACDDGDDDFGDRCTPSCQLEPECPTDGGACTSKCGDGIKTAAEACDDGNLYDGDGCARDCTVEPGYSCAVEDAPSQLQLPLVLRDFKLGWNVAGGAGVQMPAPGGHVDFENNAQNKGLDIGIVKERLGADGKPEYAKAIGGTPTTTSKSLFDQWFRTIANLNVSVSSTLTLDREPSGAYRFSDATFFPLNGLGFGNQGLSNNFAFTSETRLWFVYTGGEMVSFVGDDDIFVFVDKRLIIDLGGVHTALSRDVSLDGQGLVAGSIYELALFQAERHTTQSNYTLQLTGFHLHRSVCKP